MIVDCALYEDGARRVGELPLDRALDEVQSSDDGFVWVGLTSPGPQELAAVQDEFQLHALAVEDALHAHQRPKLEVFGDTVAVAIKAARYVDAEEIVELAELMLFVGERFVVTVRHGESSIFADVRATIQDADDELGCGPIGVLHAVLDRVVDDYASVLHGLDIDIEQIEQQVFSLGGINHAERIYKLKRQVLAFRQAVLPLREPLDALQAGRVPHLESVPVAYFRDVHDHVVRVSDRIESLSALLDSVLAANLAQVGVRQNEDMRKISAWVAIAGVSTLIAGVYGMNFEHMPELGWTLGYPFALALMGLSSLLLFRMFRRRGWV